MSDDTLQAGQTQQTEDTGDVAPKPRDPLIGELRDEAAKRRIENRELKKTLETMQAQMAAALQAIEAERTARQEAEKQAAEQRVAAQRLEQAAELAGKYGLPQILAGRLQGSTAEELEADAQRLAESLATVKRPSVPSVSTANSVQGSDLEQRAKDLLNRVTGGGQRPRIVGNQE
jgi:hypothetical protein